MKSSKPLVTLLIIMLLVVPLIASCAAQSAPTGDPGGDESPMESSGDEPDQGDGSEDIGNVYLTCPEVGEAYKLLLNHSFEFSPDEKMVITGNTSPGAGCPLILIGNVLTADECVVDYEFSGYIQGSDARCDIEGASTALIEIEGKCWDAKSMPDEIEYVAQVHLTIIEGQNPDADLGGVINCPGYSNLFLSFYPATLTDSTFFKIQKDGYTANDSGLDFTTFFDYDKSWTLIPATLFLDP
ncbi:MAG: hypothetical protein ACERKY_10345 [Anaerolineales bacterium]